MADDQTPTPESPESPDTPESTESTDASQVADAPLIERPEQEVTVEDAGPARKKVTIEIPESRIKAKIEEGFSRLQNDSAIPGFRRGRAPQRLIEKRFGDSIRDDVKGQLLSEAYSQALEDNSLEPIGEPDVKDIEEIELPESGPMKFELEIEVTPEVELPSLEGIDIKREKAEVTDERIDQEIDRYREQMGGMQPVEDADAQVQAEDFVGADVTIFAGDKIEDGAEPVAEHPGTYIIARDQDGDNRGHVAGIVVDDLGKQLIGKKAGDVVEIATTGPQSHENDQIKDQPIVIRIAITGIERLEPATLEQLIEQAGAEDEAKLREQISGMLEQQVQQEQQTKMRDQVREHLNEKVDMELPEGLTGRQIERQLQRQRMEMLYRGTSEQDVEQKMAELRTESEEQARKQLKEFFILDKAAKELDVEVAQNEINGRVSMMAMQRGRRPEKMRQEMQRSGELENLYLSIREQKTLDAVIDKANVTDIDAPAEDDAAEETSK